MDLNGLEWTAYHVAFQYLAPTLHQPCTQFFPRYIGEVDCLPRVTWPFNTSVLHSVLYHGLRSVTLPIPSFPHQCHLQSTPFLLFFSTMFYFKVSQPFHFSPVSQRIEPFHLITFMLLRLSQLVPPFLPHHLWMWSCWGWSVGQTRSYVNTFFKHEVFLLPFLVLLVLLLLTPLFSSGLSIPILSLITPAAPKSHIAPIGGSEGVLGVLRYSWTPL